MAKKRHILHYLWTPFLGIFFLFLLLVNFSQPASTLLSPLGKKFFAEHTLQKLTNQKKGREVFGFAPYWTIDKLDNVDFNILTTLAYFGVGIKDNGDIDTSQKGYETFQSDDASKLFQKAHDHGARVVVTLEQMDNDTILHFLDNPDAQKNAITQTIQLVKDRGIDGVNVDYEYVGDDPGQDYRDKFTGFMKQLTQQMHTAIPSSQVTVSVYATAVKYPKLYDIQALAKNSDTIFMMAYDFATTDANTAMPTSPLHGYKNGTYWYDVATAVDDFLTVMPADKLIVGFPWYAYNYVVYQPGIKASTRPSYSWRGQPMTQTYAISSREIHPNMPGITGFKSGWDTAGQVGWKAYYVASTGTWRIIFQDDVKSLGLKYDFIKQRNLAGTGIWALGFDDGKKELWSLLEDKFGTKVAYKN